MNQSFLHDIDRRVREVLAQSPAADLEKNLRSLLTSFFARVDLVTREEFDVQRQVLLRTREKLTSLETRVSELERALAQKETAAREEPPSPTVSIDEPGFSELEMEKSRGPSSGSGPGAT